MNIRSDFEMKHTDFLEMSSTSSNNSSEGRRGAPGSGVTFVPGGRPQRIMLRINGGGPLPAVRVEKKASKLD